MAMLKTSDNPSPGISYRDEVRRKIVHLGSLWMPLAIVLLPRPATLIGFGAAALASLLVEHAYAKGNRHIVPLYDFFFRGMLRKKPEPGQWIVSGGPYVLMAACLSVALFPSAVAAAGMGTMLLGDTAAALVGRRWGRHKLVNGKSLEGVAAFWIAGWIGAAAFLALARVDGLGAMRGLAAGGVVLASMAELFEKQLHIDDNFSIPVAVGVILMLPALVAWCR